MVKVGILGANGFIGRRAVEMFLERGYEVVPIVRNESRIVDLPQTDLEWRFANALDETTLTRAFADCEIILHSVLGSAGMIRASAKPAYRAARNAGVRRLVYLSTMCVHGQAPETGTTEASPLKTPQAFPYNSAKIAAEQTLLRLQNQDGRDGVEVVIFRPGIVFGPRSRWIVGLAEELTHGRAYVTREGQGICNTIYVDNLIHAIHLSNTVQAANGEAFFVGEDEAVNWLEFYQPFAEAFGVDSSTIARLEVPQFSSSLKQRLSQQVWDSVAVQSLLAKISEDQKEQLKKKLSGVLPKKKKKPKTAPSPTETSQPQPPPSVSREMAALQAGSYKLPLAKAKRVLGYTPLVTLPEACNQCIEWLRKEGYRVKE